MTCIGGVAQVVERLVRDPRGRGFESRYSDQTEKSLHAMRELSLQGFFIFYIFNLTFNLYFYIISMFNNCLTVDIHECYHIFHGFQFSLFRMVNYENILTETKKRG